MTIRPKTKRRVLYMAVGSVVIAGLGTWGWQYRAELNRKTIAAWKAQGIEAYHKGDYPNAIANLSKYVSKEKSDPEALFDFGEARSRVPELDGSHIAQSIGIFRHYLELVPDNFQAQHHLLDLEMDPTQPMYWVPAVNLADDILKTHPGDLPAMKAKPQALYRVRKYAEALAASQAYNAAKPTDLEGQLLTFQIMQDLGRPQKEVLARADALAKASPNDPRFTLLQGIAYHFCRTGQFSVQQNRDDAAKSIKLLTDAAKAAPPDAQFALLAYPYLDLHQQLAASDDLMERASKAFDNADVQAAYVRRIWQRGKYQEVVDRLASLDATAANTDTTLIALKALSLHSLNNDAQANKLVSDLEKRPNEASAQAWAVALRTLFGASNLDPKDQLKAYQAAADHDRNNGIIQYLLGQTYLELGERDLALDSMRSAAGLMPGWAKVHLDLVQILRQADKGATAEAADEAKWAVVSSKTGENRINTDAFVTLLLTQFDQVQSGHDAARARLLLTDMQKFQAEVPNEPKTLPAYVTLLAEADQRDKAIAVARGAMADASEDALLNLAKASREQKLGLEADLFAAAQKQYGLTPRIAFAKAIDAWQDHRAAEGLQILTDGKTKGAGRPEQWDLALCQFYELTRDPRAKDAWEALGNANVKDLLVQTKIVNAANSAWADRSFMATTLDRVRAMAGEESTVWQLGRGRWLLGSDNLDDVGRATLVLDKLPAGEVQGHLLRSQAFEKLGKLPQATDEMARAVAASPDEPTLSYDLLRLQSATGRTDDAKLTFDALASMPNLTPPVAVAAAGLMTDQGELTRAAELLNRFPAGAAVGDGAAAPLTAQQAIDRDVQMARVLRMQGKVSEAAAAYLKFLDPAVKVAPAVLEDAADFFAAARDAATSAKFLDKLKASNLPPGQLELYTARYQEAYGTPAGVAAALDAAAKAAPADPAVTVARAGYVLRQGRWAEAVAAATAGLGAFPADPDLTLFRDAANVLGTMPNAVQATSVARQISLDPRDPANREMLGILAKAATLAPNELLDKLTDLNTRYPKYGPAYALRLQQLVDLGRTDDAVALAQRAADRFPDSADAARNAANVYYGAQQWNDAIAAATRWRARAIDNTLAPDLMIATADLFVGRAADAVSRLDAYVPDAKARPDDNVPLLTTYAEALIAQGQSDDAAALLLPWAQKSETWRVAWFGAGKLGFVVAKAPYEQAAAWVKQVEPSVPADSLPERQHLASAWFDLGTAYNMADAYGRARDVLKPFLDKPGVTLTGLMDLAAAAEQADDKAYAEQVYRRALANPGAKTDPAAAAIVRNNLAMLLLGKADPAALAEARTLAGDAATDPSNAPSNASSFYDTLARVQLKQGDAQAAADSFAKANKLMPNQVGIVIGLANTNAKLGRYADAQRYLDQIDAMLSSGGGTLTGDLQADLTSARAAMRRPAPASSSSLSGADLGAALPSAGPVPR